MTVREIILDVPVPPSVNRTRRAHGAGIARLRAWHHAADAVVMAGRQLAGQPRIAGEFEAHIIISKNCRFDIDNAIKGLVDYAVRLGVVPDDRHMCRLVVERGDAPEGVRLTLREVTS
jgi:Holliday junction resolvase RusA-like endonuclease